MKNTNTKKCYNSFSCMLSVIIIAFVLGSVLFDLTVSKPQIRLAINEIKAEVQEINKKIDAQSTYYFVAEQDSANIGEDLNK